MKKRVWAAGAGFFLCGFYLGGKILVDMINDDKMRADRNRANMMLFHDWLAFLNEGGSVERYFHEKHYQKILIYGNGLAGAKLLQALEKTDIEVAAVMDQAAHSDTAGSVIGTDARIPDVDCIVVTPVFSYEEIYDKLSERTTLPVVSIRDILSRGQ